MPYFNSCGSVLSSIPLNPFNDAPVRARLDFLGPTVTYDGPVQIRKVHFCIVILMFKEEGLTEIRHVAVV